MPKRPARPTGPKTYVSKQFTLDDIDRGVEKLWRRIAEVKALKEKGVRHDDQAIDNVELNISEMIREVFGEDSAEYDAHRYHRIWHGSGHIGMEEYEFQSGFEAGIPRTIAMLEGLIQRLEEKRGDLQQDTSLAAKATLRGFDLHQRIAPVVNDLYENGHYASAVREATIALENLVKERSGKHDLSGPHLMRTALSPDKPILRLNDMSDQTDRDEQEGFMHIAAGVALGIRNPFAHDLPQIGAQRALEYIVLISLLAKRVEEARRVVPSAPQDHPAEQE